MKLINITLVPFLLACSGFARWVPSKLADDSSTLVPAMPRPGNVSEFAKSSTFDIIPKGEHLPERAFQRNDVDDPLVHRLRKKEDPPFTVPDFNQLCIDRGLGGSAPNTHPTCLSDENERLFYYTCIASAAGTFTLRGYCDEGTFCVPTDAAGNINSQANSIKCVQIQNRGILNEDSTSDAQGDRETKPFCTKKGDGKTKFWGKLRKLTGKAQKSTMKFFARAGPVDSGTEWSLSLAGTSTTTGSYELSYNFDDSTSPWCFKAVVDLNGGTVAYDMAALSYPA